MYVYQPGHLVRYLYWSAQDTLPYRPVWVVVNLVCTVPARPPFRAIVRGFFCPSPELLGLKKPSLFCRLHSCEDSEF
jgi:hypothetical protein